MLGDHAFQARGDVDEGFIPAHPLKASLSLLAGPAQRVEHAVRAVDTFEEWIDLRTEAAARSRMGCVSTEAHGDTILYRHLPDAGVRAVMRTNAANNAARGLHTDADCLRHRRPLKPSR